MFRQNDDEEAMKTLSSSLAKTICPFISGALEVTSLQFQLTSELNATTPTFTLTCTSTGGPATTVSWTVNNHTVTEDSAHNITSQVLIDAVNAIYNHTLAVTGRLEGRYECRVSNIKSSASGYLMAVGMYIVACML